MFLGVFDIAGEIMYGWVKSPGAAGWTEEQLTDGCETDSGCTLTYGHRCATCIVGSERGTTCNLD